MKAGWPDKVPVRQCSSEQAATTILCSGEETMTSKKQTASQGFILKHGMEIDLDDAWRKLISSQFTGSAGRGFGELIQNFLDSYPASTSWKERKGVVKSGKKWISITDFGEGMSRRRLELILTLGGTDKSNNQDKIGTFGIGFFSIFNPKLSTRKVVVTTRCEDQVVEMIFTVKEAEQRPEISCRVLDKKIAYSTCIKVVFSREGAADLCLTHADRCLKYYPCQVTVNGQAHSSIWEQAVRNGASMFSTDSCDGFLEEYGISQRLDLLCKYEYLMPIAINSLTTGGYSMKYDLNDYHRRSMPWLDSVSGTVNSNALNVTISRDGFRLDSAYTAMVRGVAEAMGDKLLELFDRGTVDNDLVIANQFILDSELADYISQRNAEEGEVEENRLLERLATARVYRINGHSESVSLLGLLKMKSDNLPLFYAPRQTNLRWLGGNFRHDFIVLPPRCTAGGFTSGLYDRIFETIFDSIVNLDTIEQQNVRLKELVEDNIVDPEALSPKISFQGERDLTPEEHKLLRELEDFFSRPAIKDAISRNLYIPTSRIRAVFFDIKDQKAVIATGLFNNEGRALTDTRNCNLELRDEDGNVMEKNDEQGIVLGLHRNHDLIRAIIANRDPYRLYFSLPILAHELALCQKMLVPYSTGYHLIKERLAGDMRRALMDELLPELKAA